MKKDITVEEIHEAVKEEFDERSKDRLFRAHPVISIGRVAKKIVKKHHLPIYASQEMMQKKFEEWWESLPQKDNGLRVLFGCEAELSAYMCRDYIWIFSKGEKFGIGKGLITFHRK